MARVEVRGVERLSRKLAAIEPAIKGGIAAGALVLKGKIDTAPAARRGRMEFKSRRQLIWFVLALREGLIEVPYRRNQSPGSETLTKKWTIRTEQNGYRAVIGNNTSYGPYVQDRDEQSLYHQQTGWPTVQQVAEDEGPKVMEAVQDAVREALERSGVI